MGFKRVWETLARTKTPEQVVFGSWLAPRYREEVKTNDLQGVVELLEIRRQDLILDLGCGPLARALTHLAARGFQMVGIDISTAAVKQARETVIQHGVHENVDLVVGDAEYLPFRKRAFDRVLALSILSHLPSKASVLRALGEIHHCMRMRSSRCYLGWWLNLYSPFSLLLVCGNRLGFLGKHQRVQLLTFQGFKEIRALCRNSNLTVAEAVRGSVFWYLLYLMPKMLQTWNQRLLKILRTAHSHPSGLPSFSFDILARKTPVAKTQTDFHF